METALFNLEGKEVKKINLPKIFDEKVSSGLLHEVVTGFLANQRAGTHSTKTRGEVSASGKKPWKQKGTGRARSGSVSSPLWRKGGIAFGPKPRSYYQRIPAKKKRLALNMALASSALDGALVVIEGINVSEPKTNKVSKILSNLKANGMKALLITDKIDQNLKKSSRNIENLIVVNAKDINAYQVLWARKVIITEGALEILNKRD